MSSFPPALSRAASIASVRRSPAVIALLAIAGTAFLAASARISVALPFTPVPITGQTLAVLLVGAVYGPRLGAGTVLTYLAEGLAGLPVFAAGLSGPAVLVGPTGGYLLGFVAAAYLVGMVTRRGGPRLSVAIAAAAFVLGDAAIMIAGWLWLAHLAGPIAAWTGGVLPFIPGEIIKIAVATAVASSGRELLSRL